MEVLSSRHARAGVLAIVCGLGSPVVGEFESLHGQPSDGYDPLFETEAIVDDKLADVTQITQQVIEGERSRFWRSSALSLFFTHSRLPRRLVHQYSYAVSDQHTVMGDGSEPTRFAAALRYGLILVVLGVYAGVLIGGFIAVFHAMAWIDANVLQPMVDGSELLSLALMGTVLFSYVWAVFRLTTSDAVRVMERGAISTAFWETSDSPGSPGRDK